MSAVDNFRLMAMEDAQLERVIHELECVLAYAPEAPAWARAKYRDQSDAALAERERRTY